MRWAATFYSLQSASAPLLQPGFVPPLGLPQACSQRAGQWHDHSAGGPDDCAAQTPAWCCLCLTCAEQSCNQGKMLGRGFSSLLTSAEVLQACLGLAVAVCMC